MLGDADASVIGTSLHGACFCRERVRSVRLRSPLWKSSMSLLLLGVMRRKRMFAMSFWVSSGICGQMVMPESDVRVPMSLSRVLACKQTCVNILVFGSPDV